MEIHKPKAAHSLREFLIEIGTIICGILIALGLEQGLEALHEANVTEQSRRDVSAEAAVNLSLMNVRTEEAPCIARRLAEIDGVLTRAGEDDHGGKTIWVGRPSDVPLFAERWQSVASSGRTSLFPPNEQKALDNLFAIFGEFRQAELREQAAWTKLKLLERWGQSLDPAARAQLFQTVEEARHEDYEIRRSAYFAIGLAHGLKISADPTYGNLPGTTHSVCIPSDTPLDKARAQQKDRVPDPD